jgi:hypothetical protein
MIRSTITIISCVLCLSAGVAIAPEKVVDRPVEVVRYVPVFQPIKSGKYLGEQRDRLAAAIPASALNIK